MAGVIPFKKTAGEATAVGMLDPSTTETKPVRIVDRKMSRQPATSSSGLR
jgi:hypothetical protein